MEKISWTDYMRNEEVLLRVKEQRNILHEIRKRKANWIGHILRGNCLLQRVIEGKIQGGIEVIIIIYLLTAIGLSPGGSTHLNTNNTQNNTNARRQGRRGRRRTKLLDDLKERRGYSHLKEEALDRTIWRACFGRGFGPVVRQTTK
jgi:hypothetical protein